MSKQGDTSTARATSSGCSCRDKILKLSLILKEYQTPSEYTEDRNDELGRKIIYNKYILFLNSLKNNLFLY